MSSLSRIDVSALLLALGSATVLQLFYPIFGDEAYLISWGAQPAWVYYDNPPLTGWVSAVLMSVEHGLGWLPHGTAHRAFSLILYAIAALIVLRRYRAGWAVFLTLPGMALVFNMYLNDTLLAFLTLIFFMSIDALWRGERGRIWPVLLAASIALALLTKFLFGLYYAAAVFALLWDAQGRRLLSGPFLAASLSGSAVFAFYLWFLSGACSVTLGFNFMVRYWEFPSLTGLLQGLLVTGVIGGLGLVTFGAAKLRGRRATGLSARMLVWCCVLLPVAGFLTGGIGLHWALPLGWPLVMAIRDMNDREGRSVAVWAATYGWLFMGLIGWVVVLAGTGSPMLRDALPYDVRYEVDTAYDLSDGSLPRALSDMRGDRVLAGGSHHLSAAMINADLPGVTTLTSGIYGRNQDIFTDFSLLDGRDFLILPTESTPDLDRFRPLFDSVEVIPVRTDRRRYNVISAEGFDFEAYKAVVMAPLIRNFYDRNLFPSRACFIDRFR